MPLSGAAPLVRAPCTVPLPGIRAAIVDEAGQDVPAGKGRALDLKRRVIDPRCCAPSRTILCALRRATSGTESAASCTISGDGAVRDAETGHFKIAAASTTRSTCPAIDSARRDRVGGDCEFVVAGINGRKFKLAGGRPTRKVIKTSRRLLLRKPGDFDFRRRPDPVRGASGCQPSLVPVPRVTGLSSAMKASRHSECSVTCLRSSPSLHPASKLNAFAQRCVRPYTSGRLCLRNSPGETDIRLRKILASRSPLLIPLRRAILSTGNSVSVSKQHAVSSLACSR